MKVAVAATSLALVLSACADEFYLSDSAGQSYGPFAVKEGAKVQIGGQEFTVARIRTNRDALLERLKGIIIPDVNFREEDVRDVLDFLQEASVEFDPEKKGVSLILNLGAPPATSAPDHAPSDEPEIGAVESRALPPVTFTARDIPCLEALRIVTTLTGLKYRAEGDVVMVTPLDAPDGEIITRMYDVYPTCLERIGQRPEAGRGGNFMESGDQGTRRSMVGLKQFFAEMGVQWPAGSYVKYTPMIGKLIVANTEDNLRTFERVLDSLNVTPYQIEVEVQVVSFQLTELAEIAPGGITQGELLNLWTNGHGQLVAAPKVLTQSGAEATVKGVTEVIYPTRFTTQGVADTNASQVQSCMAPGPGGFETREVGVILTVLPEGMAEGSAVNVTLTPEVVGEPEWRDYGWTVNDENGNEVRRHAEQPFFHRQAFSTSVLTQPGATLLIGGGAPTRGGENAVYAFLTVRKIDLRGKEIALPAVRDPTQVPGP